jgi:quinolinate synthase
MVAGVRFMGETAKILNPEKRVLMPTLEATCSLDLGCPVEVFGFLRPAPGAHRGGLRQHLGRGEGACRLGGDLQLRAGNRRKPDGQRRDHHLGPDQHLGRYIQKQTGADMLLWDGACIVHEEFKAKQLGQALTRTPRSWCTRSRRKR